MKEIIEEQMQDTIDLISRGLQDAVLDIQLINQNKNRGPISRVRCDMLLGTLRNTITRTHNLESSIRH